MIETILNALRLIELYEFIAGAVCTLAVVGLTLTFTIWRHHRRRGMK